MITCKLQGGLGNLLFQIATTYALAKRHGLEVYFDLEQQVSSVTKHFDSLDVYKTNIFSRLPLGPKQKHRNRYKEPFFHYKEIPPKKDLFLHGYFQSYRYFDDQKEHILKLFESSHEFSLRIKKKYGEILDKDTVSLHIRRGDYLKFQQIHPVQEIDYYKKGLRQLNSKGSVLIFSDDIQWCKKHFSKSYYFIEGQSDVADLYLMALCPYNIICNSSFSWWAAYLNKNPNKKVIAPKHWFGPSVKHNIKDLYCKDWILL